MPADLMTELTGSPPPSDRRVRRGALVFFLLVAPFVWFLQLLINASLVSQACNPAGGSPADFLHEGWGWFWWAMLAINLAAIALAAAGVIVAFRVWYKSREEGGAERYGLVEVGEGRNRFLAAWGIVGGGLFFVFGTGFATVAIFLVPACAS